MHMLLRRHRGLILRAGVVAAGAASFAAAAVSISPSTPTSATLSAAPHSSPAPHAHQFVNASLVTPPACAPQSPTCNPTRYTPPVYLEAVGFGATEAKAQQDAEQEADQVCGLRGWTRVKGFPEELARQYKYTLTYTCG